MSNSNLGKPTVTVAEAMVLLGLSRATIVRYLRRGHLAGFQVNPGQAGSWWRVYQHSIDELLAGRDQGGSEAQ